MHPAPFFKSFLCALFACSSALPVFGEGAAQALKGMKVAEGFEVTLVASEPEIRQPISITFDHRGRMWVVQYLQYPTPAGLKAVKVDQYLRTTYDQRPEPPPRGPKGADRITICDDTDGDGRMDKFKDFVSGLNLCSGMALGHGGVFVVQPPYLLFYRDKNRDDVPDGDPEVLLTGFGMEDAHAFANSLTWGPDGWLYGAQGSTVTANIRGIEFQQGIWRYHPVTRKFELFCEGGGNTWGVDFDEEGEIFAGTNFNEKMLHHVQGAYYVKNFGKHGALHNPFTYGYFDHVPFSGYAGKHISIGGIIYQGGSFPPEFNGKYIFGNTLDHAVYWADRKVNGSTFTSSFGGALLKTDDELFRPVDCTVGPDGAVYVADWCDKRATHVDPLDTWDRSNGRIYKIQKTGTETNAALGDLSKFSNDRLLQLLSHRNDWYARQARVLLAERAPKELLPKISKMFFEPRSARLNLHALWTYYSIEQSDFDDGLTQRLLKHENPAVVSWTARLLCDDGKVSRAAQVALIDAAINKHPRIVQQLACSAKRLSDRDALPIIYNLLLHNEVVDDPFIPLLVWWALEDKAISSREQVLQLFYDKKIWRSALVQRHILERLARRYTDEGGPDDFAACAELLSRASDLGGTSSSITPDVEKLLTGIDKALVGKSVETIPGPLGKWFARAWEVNTGHPLLTRVGLRFNQRAVLEFVPGRLQDEKVPEAQRVEWIEILGQSGKAELYPLFLQLLKESSPNNIKIAALRALQRYSNPDLAEALLEIYPRLAGEVRAHARAVLESRASSASALVTAVESKTIPAKDVSIEEVRKMAALKDESLNRRLEKIWGKIQSDSPAELENTINRLKLVIKPSGVAGRDSTGNPLAGKKVFDQACAACHKLFGEGASIGPDLTAIDRKDLGLLLANIVNPSGYIRTEFMAHEVETKDDQVISGMVAESAANAVTIVDRSNQRHVIARQEIREMRESATSLMPEGLLESLSTREILDLFSYLQKD